MKKIFICVMTTLISASALAFVEIKCSTNKTNAEDAIKELNVLILPTLGKVKNASAVSIIQGTLGEGHVQACVTIVK